MTGSLRVDRVEAVHAGVQGASGAHVALVEVHGAAEGGHREGRRRGAAAERGDGPGRGAEGAPQDDRVERRRRIGRQRRLRERLDLKGRRPLADRDRQRADQDLASAVAVVRPVVDGVGEDAVLHVVVVDAVGRSERGPDLQVVAVIAGGRIVEVLVEGGVAAAAGQLNGAAREGSLVERGVGEVGSEGEAGVVGDAVVGEADRREDGGPEDLRRHAAAAEPGLLDADADRRDAAVGDREVGVGEVAVDERRLVGAGLRHRFDEIELHGDGRAGDAGVARLVRDVGVAHVGIDGGDDNQDQQEAQSERCRHIGAEPILRMR